MGPKKLKLYLKPFLQCSEGCKILLRIVFVILQYDTGLQATATIHLVVFKQQGVAPVAVVDGIHTKLFTVKAKLVNLTVKKEE